MFWQTRALLWMLRNLGSQHLSRRGLSLVNYQCLVTEDKSGTKNLLKHYTCCHWQKVQSAQKATVCFGILSRITAAGGNQRIQNTNINFFPPFPLLGFMGVDSDISPRQARLFTRPLHYTDYTYLEQIDKEPPPFQSTGHGRYQRWSRWNCDFISAINYLVSDEKIYEGTCERKSQLAGIWQRRLIWWDILVAVVCICIASISCSSWSVEVCVGIPPAASNWGAMGHTIWERSCA